MQQPLKIMSKEVYVLTAKFRQSKIQMMLLPRNYQQDETNENVRYVGAFQYILDSMIPENRQIIINDFIERKSYLWWMEMYTRSTYYRQKNKAVKELLEAMPR
jgi:hypothetical protein